MDTTLKPAWQSSELWITIAVNIIGVLAITGVLNPTDAPEVSKHIIAIIGGVFQIVSSSTFVWSRTSVKKAQQETIAKIETAKINATSMVEQAKISCKV